MKKSAHIIRLANKYRKDHPQWRWGQSIWNAAEDLYPDLIYKIRSTVLDPFYNDQRVALFLEEIDKNGK